MLQCVPHNLVLQLTVSLMVTNHQHAGVLDTCALQTMVYRSSPKQLLTAYIADGFAVMMDSNSVYYCTQTVIAVVYRARFKITQSIDCSHDYVY